MRLNQEVQALTQQPPIFTFISQGEHASQPGGSGPYPAATNLYVYFPSRTCVFRRRFRPLPSSHQSLLLFPKENMRLNQGVQALTQQPPIFTFISVGERASSPGGSGPYPTATNLYVYFRRRTCVFTRRSRPLPSSHQSLLLFPKENMRLNQEVQALTQQPPIFTFISQGEHASQPGGSGPYPAATNLYVYFPSRTCVFRRRFRPLPSSHQSLLLFPKENMRLNQGVQALTQQPPIFTFISVGERASSPGGSGPYPAATNLYVYFRRRTCVFTRRSRPLPSSHQSLRLFP